jgi:iron complex outermembrane receptor protein
MVKAILLASPETGLEAFSTNETSGMTSGRFSMLLRFAMLLLAAISLAHAQEVVVTATRFPDSKQDLPVGVTVITTEDIRRSASTNLTEIIAQQGLVHVRNTTGSPNQQLDLRGFGITGDQNTLVLVDGVRVSENEQASAQLATIPLDSIERIEIVRGSGAVLYGGGASGGTINIITRGVEPNRRRAYGIVRFGGFDTKEGRFGWSQMGEALGASLDVSHEDSDGFRHNNRFRQLNATGTLHARTAAGRAYLRAALGEQRLGLPGALTEAQMATDRRQAASPLNGGEREDGTLTVGGAWNVAAHEVAADFSVRRKHASTFFRPAFFVDTRVEQLSFVPRTKLRFDAFGREHEVTLGFDWEKWDYENRNSPSPATVTAPFSQRLGDQENRALYGQANLRVAERTRVVLGARAQQSEERLVERVFPPDDRRVRHDLEAFEAALRQRFDAGWAAYAKAGTSFRLANFDDNACFAPPCGFSLLSPQTAKTSELGVDYESLAWRGRASVFETKLENEIYFSPLTFTNLNLSPTRRRGFELEASWRATRALELRGALAVTQARFRSGTYNGVDVSGKTVPLVPEHMLTAGVSWAFAPRTRANLDLRHVGEQYFDNDQANQYGRQQPAYEVLDLKVTHAVQRFEVALEVRNLLDRKFYSYGVCAANFLTGTCPAGGSFSAYPAPERAVYASLAWRLD